MTPILYTSPRYMIILIIGLNSKELIILINPKGHTLYGILPSIPLSHVVMGISTEMSNAILETQLAHAALTVKFHQTAFVI